MSAKDHAVEEQAVLKMSTLLEMTYQDAGTRCLYSDIEIVFQAAAWLGNKPIIEDMLQRRKQNQIQLNLSFHGAEALTHLIQKTSLSDLLPGDEPIVRTRDAIEIIQLMVSHGVRVKDEHLKEAVSGKNLELVQYLITQLGLDVTLAIRNRVPGADHIREWAKEWKKVSKLKSKLSTSLNKKEDAHKNSKNRGKI